MKRRSFLLSAAAATGALALPATGRAAAQSTLKFIPQIDLAFLDPHWTTAYVTRNHGYMVFDTLYGQNSKFETSAQMVAGHTVEDDGKLWKLTLRDGLMWHDGTPVLARDCVASIRRWAKRDPFGDTLMQTTDELSAPGDKVIQFRLKRPFPLLPDALGKVGSPMPAMMPERLALTDPFKQITDIVGSGPFRYVASERIAGSRNVYEKFAGYKPREDGVTSGTAGPKLVHFDRVEWTTIPDAATAAAALQSGEQDWWEYLTFDMMPLMQRDKNIRVATPDPTGGVEMLRPNHLQPPFNNPDVRRAVMRAINQVDYMQSVVGDHPDMYYTPLGVFCPHTPMASDVGLEPLKGKRDYARVKEMLKKAGYAGEKTVLLIPTDYIMLKAFGDIAADEMQKCGMNVDYQATDWGTMLQRRNKKDPVDKGGWSMFATGWSGADQMNPAGHLPLRGNGDQAGAWPGWYTSAEMERLRDAWFVAPDLAAQQKICRDMQGLAMHDVAYYPLGQYQQPTAYRANLTGLNTGFATFWSIRRS